MGWRDWPYWIKGGILLIIYGLLTLPLALIVRAFWSEGGKQGILKLIVFPFIIANSLVEYIAEKYFCGYSCNQDTLFILGSAILLSLIIYFVIGAIIGLIYSKVKKKN